MPKISSVHAVVSGKVQGVGFRWFVENSARTFGLTGWVKNLFDGAVEIVAEGDKEVLRVFLDGLKTDHSGAFVDEIREDWSDSEKNYFKDFRILF